MPIYSVLSEQKNITMDQIFIPSKYYKVLCYCITYNQAKYIEDGKHPTPIFGGLKYNHYLCAVILKTRIMAISSKDIETLWGRYQSEGVSKGVSVSQYFEANGIPYVSPQFMAIK